MHRSIIIRCCTTFIPTLKQCHRLGVEAVMIQPSFHSLRTSAGPRKNVNRSSLTSLLPFSSSSSTTTTTSAIGSSSDTDNSMNSDTSEIKNQYRKSYQISGIGTKSSVAMKTNTGHTMQTDVPKQMGGGDEAPQPVETLLAAWMGCTQATALFVGRNMEPRLLIDKIEFELEAYRDERGALGGDLPIVEGSELPDIPARLEKVVGVVKVYPKKRRGDEVLLTEKQLFLLGEHTERRCPVGK
jgi:hypothetical protein